MEFRYFYEGSREILQWRRIATMNENIFGTDQEAAGDLFYQKAQRFILNALHDFLKINDHPKTKANIKMDISLPQKVKSKWKQNANRRMSPWKPNFVA